MLIVTAVKRIILHYRLSVHLNGHFNCAVASLDYVWSSVECHHGLGVGDTYGLKDDRTMFAQQDIMTNGVRRFSRFAQSMTNNARN